MPHACVTGLGDDLCEEMVVLRADAVVCVRGMVLGADA